MLFIWTGQDSVQMFGVIGFDKATTGQRQLIYKKKMKICEHNSFREVLQIFKFKACKSQKWQQA